MNPSFRPRFWAVRPRPQETVREGERGLRRTVGAMDGAIEPPGTGLRRVLRSPLSSSKPIATRRRKRPPMNRPNRTTHPPVGYDARDRKNTRPNSSHSQNSYAVFVFENK